jgi:hypothetical protein
VIDGLVDSPSCLLNKYDSLRWAVAEPLSLREGRCLFPSGAGECFRTVPFVLFQYFLFYSDVQECGRKKQGGRRDRNFTWYRSLSESEFSVEEQEHSLEVDAFLEEFCDGYAILDADQLLWVKEAVESTLSKTMASERNEGLSGNQGSMKLWVSFFR